MSSSSSSSPVAAPASPHLPSNDTPERAARRQQLIERLEKIAEELQAMQVGLPPHLAEQLARQITAQQLQEFSSDSVAEMTDLFDAVGLEDSHLRLRLEALMTEKGALVDELWDEYDAVNIGY
jgi:hypothetical protein